MVIFLSFILPEWRATSGLHLPVPCGLSCSLVQLVREDAPLPDLCWYHLCPVQDLPALGSEAGPGGLYSLCLCVHSREQWRPEAIPAFGSSPRAMEETPGGAFKGLAEHRSRASQYFSFCQWDLLGFVSPFLGSQEQGECLHLKWFGSIVNSSRMARTCILLAFS